MKKIVVIGGGAAGMLAAGVAAKAGNKVYLLEKNEKLGKKIYITGKGRCNLTNASNVDIILENILSNPYFMYSSLYNLDSFALIDFFKENGLDTKIERGNRVFPISEKASDVIKTLEKFMHKNNVKIELNTEVKTILVKDKQFQGVITNKSETIVADSVIVATGGISYPATGSTGDGYKFARALGHHVTKLYPSLVSLKTDESFVPKLQGLSLKNVGLTVVINGKNVYKDFGEMLFTHNGVTGPIILSSSRFLIGKHHLKPEIMIDLKSALTEKELDARIIRDFDKYINKDFSNALDDLLPQKLIPIVIELSGIPHNMKVNEITKEKRKFLGNLLKNFKVTVTGSGGFEEAVITCGGVSVAEVDPSTMESRLIKGLFFAGEVLDIDALTGGFNLQIAFSTGFLAGMNA